MHTCSVALQDRLIQPSSAFLLMCASARLFQCALCYTQTLICSLCDRGHQYCSASCSGKARRESLRRANRKYAQSRHGKHHNAERQRRYRLRKIRKVTDQGSKPTPPPVSLPLLVSTPGLKGFAPVVARSLSQVCHFCLARISRFLRNDFLHRSYRHQRW